MKGLPQARGRTAPRIMPRIGPRPGRMVLAGWGQRLGVTMGLGGAIAALVTVIWGSVVLLRQGQPPPWLAPWWPPTATPWRATPPQLPGAIAAGFVAQGLQPGDWIDLAQGRADPDLQGLWLLPVSNGQGHLVALHLYGHYRHTPQGPERQAIYHLPLEGVPPGAVIDPLVQGGILVSPPSQPLPLHTLQPLPPVGAASLPGAWFLALGDWPQGGRPLRYGRVLYVDPRTLVIRALTDWSSPQGVLPQWQRVGDDPWPLLVFHQGVGMEPRFQLMTLIALPQALRLESVDWRPYPPAPPDPYPVALDLARQGLWAMAEEWLRGIKAEAEGRGQWSAAAERQLFLVGLHHQVTQDQAARRWAQPSQQVLALLVDSRWEEALALVEGAGPGEMAGVRPLLRREPGYRLWQRLTTTLRYPTRPGRSTQAPRLWGALLLWLQGDATTGDQAMAEAWLARQVSPAALDVLTPRLYTLIRALGGTPILPESDPPPDPPPTPEPTPTPSPTPEAPPPVSAAPTPEPPTGETQEDDSN